MEGNDKSGEKERKKQTNVFYSINGIIYSTMNTPEQVLFPDFFLLAVLPRANDWPETQTSFS